MEIKHEHVIFPFLLSKSIRLNHLDYTVKSFTEQTKEKHLTLHIILFFILQGFTKESIQISYLLDSRMVRIVGERRIDASNKWSLFNQTYPVPENCEVEKLQGKIEHGSLIVTMPKKFIPPPTPIAQVEETTKQKETTPPKSTATRVEQQEPIGDKKISSDALKELKGAQKDTSPSQKPKDTTSHRPDDYKGLRTLSPSKSFEEEPVLKTKATAAIPKEQTGKPQMGIEPNTKQIDEEKLQEEIRKKAILEIVKKQLEEEKAEKESVKKKEVEGADIGKPYYESRKPEKYLDHDVVLKGKEIKARKESAPKSSDDKGKDRAKKDEIYTIGKGVKEVGTWTSKVVTRIGEGKLDDQEKTLVANMGAAILIIAALGAYVTYKFTSSDKT